MDKTYIELDKESYKNVHLMLHNLIELTGSISTGRDYSPAQYRDILKNINEPLKSIKTALEAK
ncbi:hypothetical protein ABC382_00945 [Lysinibacillus sp. 1P01SD]|uniref:hypothetical protein n=1 Tax=Lysinibacillus sp. 1P01SD TaxID=3132285 RepID=UPI0039A3276B